MQKQFSKSKVSGIVADSGNKIEVDNLLNNLNDIDILINNLGVFEIKYFDKITDKDWIRMFETNVIGAVRLSKKIMPKLLEKNWGRIVFITSESGVKVPGNMIHYGMTKAALSAVAKSISKLTKGTGVTVNTIFGGPTYSDWVSQVV